MRKLIALLLAFLFVFGSFGNVFAGTVTEPMRDVYSGTCGDDLTWTLETETGELEICGTGNMTNWTSSSNAPWYAYRSIITTVSILEGVTSIGNYAFYSCSQVSYFSIPNTVSSLGNDSFRFCNRIVSIEIPDSVTSIGSQAFANCSSLTSFTLPAHLTVISARLFSSSNKLESVYIPEGVTTIGSAAFNGCSMLTEIELPSTLTTINGEAFKESGIKRITIPKSVTTMKTISNGIVTPAFRGSNVEEVIFEDGMIQIPEYAFSSSSHLKSVYIPDTVTTIGSEAFRSCSSLSYAIFLGLPPTSIKNYAFSGCASDLTFYYLESKAFAWSPNGETTWNGYSIKEFESSFGKRIVTFKYNVEGMGTYSTQIVDTGSYAKMPEAPSRDGYKFIGWYSNPSCTGEKWFDQSNYYYGKTVESNVCLYAKWNEESFELDRDWFCFENNKWDFFSALGAIFDTEYHHMELISGEYLWLTLELYKDDPKAKNALADELMINDWNGSCFGMSCVAALIRAGRLDPSFFQNNAENTRDFNKPKYNKTIANLIEYYYFMQLTPITNKASWYYYDETKNCRRLIEALDSSSYPVVVGIARYQQKTVGDGYTYTDNGLHSILAIGYTETDSLYRVQCADPNYKNRFIYLDIAKDGFLNLGFDVQGYDDRPNNRTNLQGILTVEDNQYDYSNIQSFLTGRGYTSGSAARGIDTAGRSEEETSHTVLTTGFNSFTITKSSGEYAVIENGYKTEGTLDITDGAGTNEIGFELSMEFTVPDLVEGESYSINPMESISVITNEALEQYRVKLRHSSGNGFCSYIETEGNVPVTIGYDGAISTEAASPVAQLVTLSRDDAVSNWFVLDVFCEATSGLMIAPDGERIVIMAADNAEYDIAVRSFFNSMKFENICGSDAGVSVFEEDGITRIIYNGTGEVAAEDVFGYSLIFCTMGADEIETQSGIPMGGTATQPADPVREGLIFGGWYTNYECEDGTEWSFDTPITEDTFIYAKWIVNDDYMHLVTFRVEGCDDVGYLVVDGEALEDYELPEIPEREGYTAAWPELDLSCVTEDMVIEPVYTPIPYTVTFLDMDGTVIEEQTVDYGTPATAPEAPEHAGYAFVGWDVDFSVITGDLVVTAVYEPVPLVGDIDNDNLISMADVTILSMYLNGENPTVSEPGMLNADANADGTVDIRDIAAIYAIIAAS